MKKILIVSDYITNIWGIENFIQNSSDLLSSTWYEINCLWLQTQYTKKKPFRQIMSIFTSLNIYIGLKLIWIYISKKPDIIWFHSTTRFVGRLPIFVSGFFGWQKIIMYHDLWFVSSYPSKISDISQLPQNWNWQSFYETSQISPSKSFIKKIYIKGIIWLKYLSISIWRYFVIRNIDKHLIPSEFMMDILKNRWIKSQNIYLIWHFWDNYN